MKKMALGIYLFLSWKYTCFGKTKNLKLEVIQTYLHCDDVLSHNNQGSSAGKHKIQQMKNTDHRNSHLLWDWFQHSTFCCHCWTRLLQSGWMKWLEKLLFQEEYKWNSESKCHQHWHFISYFSLNCLKCHAHGNSDKNNAHIIAKIYINGTIKLGESNYLLSSRSQNVIA